MTEIQKTQQSPKPQIEEKPNTAQRVKPQKRILGKNDHLFQIKHMLDAMISQAEDIPSECHAALAEARGIVWTSIKNREERQMGISM